MECSAAIGMFIMRRQHDQNMFETLFQMLALHKTHEAIEPLTGAMS